MRLLKKNLKAWSGKLSGLVMEECETTLLLLGKQMAWQVSTMPPNTDFRKVGFKVFSQWDEDGIIQYLISKLPIENKTFIEFGVENYKESNTRFLLVNNHWQGMVLDACSEDINYIRSDKIHWQYDLQVKESWITTANINSLLSDSGFDEDIGLLSVDVDGNDYWMWEAITSIRPRIVIVEYNSIFGIEPLAVPYDEAFNRSAAHHSNLYYGCSLGALAHLAQKKGYILVGSNVWGHNAFFVRLDIASGFTGLEPKDAYVLSKFREARDSAGKLTFTRGDDRIKMIAHLPLKNVATGEVGLIRDFFRKADL